MLMNWVDATKAFIEIANYQSFSEVARRNFSSVSSLSKKIAWIEEQLGVSLFNRTTRHVTLSPDGERYYPRAQAWIDELSAMQSLMQDSNNDITGEIALTCSSAYGEEFITPFMVDFKLRYPLVKLRCIYTNDYLDLRLNNLDLGVQVSEPDKETYNYLLAGNVRRGLFATPEYLKKYGTPKKPEDLVHHQCLLHSDIRYPLSWSFKDNIRVPISGDVETNSVYALLQMCLANQGILYSSFMRCEKYLETGELVNILNDSIEKYWPVYLVTLNTVYPKKRVKVFVEELAQHLRDVGAVEQLE
jgi:DNA-binding transcriptional LysR family regulator